MRGYPIHLRIDAHRLPYLANPAIPLRKENLLNSCFFLFFAFYFSHLALIFHSRPYFNRVVQSTRIQGVNPLEDPLALTEGGFRANEAFHVAIAEKRFFSENSRHGT